MTGTLKGLTYFLLSLVFLFFFFLQMQLGYPNPTPISVTFKLTLTLGCGFSNPFVQMEGLNSLNSGLAVLKQK